MVTWYGTTSSVWKNNKPTNWPTDWPTDRPTDWSFVCLQPWPASWVCLLLLPVFCVCLWLQPSSCVVAYGQDLALVFLLMQPGSRVCLWSRRGILWQRPSSFVFVYCVDLSLESSPMATTCLLCVTMTMAWILCLPTTVRSSCKAWSFSCLHW